MADWKLEMDLRREMKRATKEARASGDSSKAVRIYRLWDQGVQERRRAAEQATFVDPRDTPSAKRKERRKVFFANQRSSALESHAASVSQRNAELEAEVKLQRERVEELERELGRKRGGNDDT